jgi:large subunit ribosomal protein L9
MAKRVQLVLNEDVYKLGRNGDLVDVAPGYARNYLLPRGLAIPVTPGVLKQVEYRRAKQAERLAALKLEAETQKKALVAVGRFTVRKQVGENEAIFGTVTNGDVAESILAATKLEVDRRDIEVPEIHMLGSYNVQIKLHPEVVVEVEVEVAAL